MLVTGQDLQHAEVMMPGREVGRGLTRTEKRGKTNPNLSDFLTSSSPLRTRMPGSVAPSLDAQKNAPPNRSANELLLRPLSMSSCVAWDPTRRTRASCTRAADGFDSRSRACSSAHLIVKERGMGLPSA